MLMSTAARRGLLLLRLFGRGFGDERGRLDTVFLGPNQLVAHRQTAAAMPAGIGARAAAGVMHAGIRPRTIFAGNWLSNDDWHAGCRRNEAYQRQTNNEPPRKQRT